MAIFWWAITGMFDVFVARTFVGQIASYWFKPAPARIVASELKHDSDSDGDTYGVQMEFVYTVDGKEYSSERYSFDSSMSSDSGWARRAVRDNPVGAERVCYYAPWNPARGILHRGVDGRNVVMLMFMTPFNLFGAFLIWALLEGRKYEEEEFLPRMVDSFQNRESWSMARMSAWLVFLATFGLTSFLGLFLVLFPSGFHPSLQRVCMIWGSALAIAIGVAARFWVRNGAGKYDLALDMNAKRLSIPAMHKRRGIKTIQFGEVRAIESRTVTKGSDSENAEQYFVQLQTRDGREFVLKEETSAARAARLAETLSKRIRVAAREAYYKGDGQL